MRRLLIGAASLLAACLTLSPYGVPAADAASPLTGRLVDSVASGHPGVPNMVVRLRAVTASGPGDVVASDVTGDKGYFALDAGSAPDDEYYVQVVAGSHQGGWVGGSPDGINQVEPTAAAGSTYGPHATLGNVRVNPAYVRGVVVDSATDGPVAEVVATVRDSNDPTMVRKDTTNSNGGLPNYRGHVRGQLPAQVQRQRRRLRDGIPGLQRPGCAYLGGRLRGPTWPHRAGLHRQAMRHCPGAPPTV